MDNLEKKISTLEARVSELETSQTDLVAVLAAMVGVDQDPEESSEFNPNRASRSVYTYLPLTYYTE